MGEIREEPKEEKGGDHHACNAFCTDKYLVPENYGLALLVALRFRRPLLPMQEQPVLATTGTVVCWNIRKNAAI